MITKTFKDTVDPAMTFITTEDTKAAEKEDLPIKEKLPAGTRAPKGYKIDPRYVELKSVHLQLLIPPSLKKKLKAKAAAQNRSVNSLVNEILESNLKGKE